MSTDERAMHLETARRMILDWLVFSTLRHYAVACHASRVRDDGTTTVSIQLEVPGPEIHAALWRDAPHPTPGRRAARAFPGRRPGPVPPPVTEEEAHERA